MGLQLHAFITNVFGGFANILIFPINLTIELIALCLNIFGTLLFAISSFFETIGKYIDKALRWIRDFVRSFFGQDGSGSAGPPSPPGPGDGGGGGGGLTNNVQDELSIPEKSFTITTRPFMPSPRTFQRLYHSVPGDGSTTSDLIEPVAIIEPTFTTSDLVESCAILESIDLMLPIILRTVLILSLIPLGVMLEGAAN